MAAQAPSGYGIPFHDEAAGGAGYCPVTRSTRRGGMLCVRISAGRRIFASRPEGPVCSDPSENGTQRWASRFLHPSMFTRRHAISSPPLSKCQRTVPCTACGQAVKKKRAPVSDAFLRADLTPRPFSTIMVWKTYTPRIYAAAPSYYKLGERMLRIVNRCRTSGSSGCMQRFPNPYYLTRVIPA